MNENVIGENKNLGELFDVGLDFLIGFLTIKQIGTVSAISHDLNWCCTETNAGATCQDVSFGDTSSCSPVSPTACSLTAECKQGTCIDRNEGICSANSPKKSCEDLGLRWESRPLDEISECRLGCCILGANVNYITENQCNLITDAVGIDNVDFRTGFTEQECLGITLTLAKGACVLPGGNCRMVKGIECQEMGGEFNRDLLCTNPILETNCKPTEETTCSSDEREYDVYFKDSCGNTANVYDSSKSFNENNKEYWERIIEPICNSDNPASCGMCNYPTESRCLEAGNQYNPVFGDLVCRDLKCDDNGRERLNGESWCIYESRIGDGRDVVGSDHWLKYCENGEVKIDDTQQKFRGEICAEKEVPLQTGGFFSVAQYRPNFWGQCFNIIIESDDAIAEQRNEKRCNANPDCKVLSINVPNSNFNFKLCVPEYPKGFDSSPGADNSAEKAICGFATQTCIVIEEKKIDKGWEIEVNKGCTSKHGGDKFATEMNKFCTALGDCGGKVNVAGVYERNYRFTWDITAEDPDLSGVYIPNANPSLSDESPLYIFNPSNAGSYSDVAANVGDLGEATPPFLIEHAGSIGAIAGLLASFGIFPVFFVIVAIIFIIIVIAGIGDTREKYVTFTCDLWEPPIGGADCSKCHDGSLGDLPCTQYKCNSLGTGCDLINTDTENPICIYDRANDVVPSTIIFESITNNGEEITNLNDFGQAGFEVTEEVCIENFDVIEINLKTVDENGNDDYARCMYDYSPVEPTFNNIKDAYTLGDGEYNINHTFEEILYTTHPGIKDLVQGTTETTGKLDIYARCQDPGGNYNLDEYKISFSCITSIDTTAPRVLEFIPTNPWILPFKSTTSVLQIRLNEIAECSYDFNPGIEYSSMNYNFACDSGRCTADVEELDKEINKIYIKCKDTNGNTNVEDILYVFDSTINPLKIDSIQPQGEITVKGLPFSFDLEVTTSGGSDDGNAFCEYEFRSHPQFSINRFLETGGNTHKQPFPNLPSGSYDVEVICRDIYGNEAKSPSVFSLKVDSSAPEIVRAFKDGNKLKLITDEIAICYYDTDPSKECNFNINNATSTTTILSTQHSLDWDRGKTYFVKCEDIFENVNKGYENGGCAIIVNPA